MEHIAIIGNGISGITAARHIRKRSNARITVISAETPHFFSRTALMYIYMGHMKYEHTKPYEDEFWEKNRIDLVYDRVMGIDVQGQRLEMQAGQPMAYDRLILATGSVPNRFGWPGQDLPGVQSLYSYQDLQLLEENTHPPMTKEADREVRQAVIVGGGLIGVEMAEMLLTRGIGVTFLIREKWFWGNVLPKEEGALIQDHIQEHGVKILSETELKEILPGEDGRVKAITTSHGDTIECQLVGLTAGVRPNIDFLKNTGIETDRGIMVNEFLETNIENVYAIGDCAQFRTPLPGRRPVEQVWYTGRMMGECLAATISGTPTAYQPGPWFNSAKFFDIEYQTYGTVLGRPREGESTFYWQHPKERVAIKIVFDSESHEFIGINSFGIRLRHELFDKWLRQKRTVEHVVEALKNANFDPEFYETYEDDIVSDFNKKFNTNIKPSKRSWRKIFSA